MKKQKFLRLCRTPDKDYIGEEATGYIINLTDNDGYTVKIALWYSLPYWKATHVKSGLDCTLGLYKTKESLIEKLKTIPFSTIEKKEHLKPYIEIIEKEYAEREKQIEESEDTK